MYDGVNDNSVWEWLLTFVKVKVVVDQGVAYRVLIYTLGVNLWYLTYHREVECYCLKINNLTNS